MIKALKLELLQHHRILEGQTSWCRRYPYHFAATVITWNHHFVYVEGFHMTVHNQEMLNSTRNSPCSHGSLGYYTISELIELSFPTTGRLCLRYIHHLDQPRHLPNAQFHLYSHEIDMYS